MFEGYSPLAKGQVLSDPTVLQIAEKYRRTPAQICIRWSIQVVKIDQILPQVELSLIHMSQLIKLILWFSFFSSEWSCHDTEIRQREEDKRKLSSELELLWTVWLLIMH